MRLEILTNQAEISMRYHAANDTGPSKGESGDERSTRGSEGSEHIQNEPNIQYCILISHRDARYL